MAVCSSVSAATLYWDADGSITAATGGNGVWETTLPLWHVGSPTGSLQTWTDSTGTSDIADFAGTAGTVTLNTSLGASGLIFGTTGYSLSGAGTLNLGSGGIDASALGTSTTTTINTALNLVRPQTWSVGAGSTLAAKGAVANNGNLLTLANAGNLTFSNVLSGTGGLAQTGTGTTTLSAANTYTGSTSLSAGSLTLNGTTGSISSSASTTVTGGTLTLDYTSAVVDRLNDMGAVTLSRGGALVIASATSTSFLEKIGALGIDTGNSTVTSSATNSKISALEAASFSRANNATALLRGSYLDQTTTPSGTGTFQLTLDDKGKSLTLVGTSTLSGGAPDDATKALKIVPYLLGDRGTTLMTGNNFITYDSTLGFRVLTSAENTSLNADSTTVAAAPINAYLSNISGNIVTLTSTGDLTINSLLFSATGQSLDRLSKGGDLIVNSGAVAVAGNNAGTATIGSNFGKLTLGNDEGVLTAILNTTLTINTPVYVTNSGGLTKAGGGTVILTANNLYTGNTVINEGTLQIGNGGTTSGNLGMGSGTINNYGTLTIKRGAGSSPLSLGGAISGTGSFVQAGGLTVLSGANTYTGPTMINAGTLLLNNASGSGTGSGVVTVAAGATLGGAGTISAAHSTVTVGGTLSPGMLATPGTAGTLNLAIGALTLTSSSTLAFDITSTATKDLVALNGTSLTLNGTLALTLPNANSSGIDYTKTYALFTGINGTETGSFSSVTGYDKTDFTAVLRQNGTEYDLSFIAPVPEPGTWLGGFLMLGAAGFSRRRWLAGLWRHSTARSRV